MYPNIRYFVYKFTHIDVKALGAVQMYGFWLAMAFLAGAWWLTKELKRREALGMLSGVETVRVVGKPVTFWDLFSNFLFGFLLGYKIVHFVLNADTILDPISYIGSSEGSWLWGIVIGLGLAGLKWYEVNAAKLPEPREEAVMVMPHQRISDIVILAAISGILGAKILYALEYWDDFIRDPLAQLLSPSGITVYGGMIGGFLAVSYYLKKYKMPYLQMLDVFAPALILAYGVGRLACHCSGDGCWGIPNPNPVSWLPSWMTAEHYLNNVSNTIGDANVKVMADCNGFLQLSTNGTPEGGYCTQLITGVYPTPLYEFLMCLAIFGFLVVLNQKIQNKPALLFSIYMIFNGLERFFIEFVRVNERYTLMGMTLSMSQFIAIAILLVGLIMTFVFSKKYSQSPT